ncbi:MAG TPA: protein kinase, partial [Vicinamibacterales bacterium]|nr:protein kinase [Vicinamibacterales bacterium]
PANIQVTSDGIAKVLDFGLARVKYADAEAAEKSLTGTGVMLGTPGYVAPERLLSSVLNASGDIYSIGVVMFEMVTGRRLFERGQTPEHLFDTMSGKTLKASSVIASLPQGLDDVIERALSVDPRLRYQSAHELSRDVQVILKSLDTQSVGLNISVPVPVPVAVPAATREAPVSDVRRWVYGALGLITVVALAGFTTSGVYNLGLGRTAEFDPESPFMHLYWGVRSMMGPTLLGVAAIILLGVTSAIGRVPMKMAGPLTDRLVPPSTRTRVIASVYRVPIAPVAAVLLVAELVTLWLLWNRFEPLLWSISGFIRQSTDTSLGALNPVHAGDHRSFRQLFSLHLLVFAAAWLQVMKLRSRRGERDGRIVVAGGLALTLLSLELLVMPYRILIHNDAERIFISDSQAVCYLVGQRDESGLLFCPMRPPRTRVVRLDDPRLTRGGTSENIFMEVE